MPRARRRPASPFEDGAGNRVSLGDFKGKNVVVYFYPKDDTPGCTKEACGFRDLWKDLQRAGVVVLGVSADGAFSLEQAVRMLTLVPSTLWGFADRGLVSEGFAADLVVFDPETIAPEMPESSTISRPAPVGWCSAPADSRRWS